MNIIDAFKSGKKVRRISHFGNQYGHGLYLEPERFSLFPEDVLADDWDIEPDYWEKLNIEERFYHHKLLHLRQQFKDIEEKRKKFGYFIATVPPDRLGESNIEKLVEEMNERLWSGNYNRELLLAEYQFPDYCTVSHLRFHSIDKNWIKSNL